MAKEIRIFDTPPALSLAAADIVVAAAQSSIDAKGRFSICLSGGNTPRLLYEVLASRDYINRIDWSKVDVFWGDERCVPPEHEDSDYRMAREALFDHLGNTQFPRIYRIPAEIPPAFAEESYQSLLSGYFSSLPGAGFDLLLLGMGDDGHTASLFPGTQAIHEKEKWVVGHFVPKLSAWRITLTPPLLNLSAHILFLVTGSGKRAILNQVLFGPVNPDLLPSQVIQPASNRLTWLVDREAYGD